MHPVAEYRKELDDLRAEVAQLRRSAAPRVDPDASVPNAVKENCTRTPDGRWLNSMGFQVWPHLKAGTDNYAERIRADNLRRERLAANEETERSKGLPARWLRDPCGIIRDRKSGAIIPQADLDRLNAPPPSPEETAAEKARGEQVRRDADQARAERISQGIPALWPAGTPKPPYMREPEPTEERS